MTLSPALLLSLAARAQDATPQPAPPEAPASPPAEETPMAIPVEAPLVTELALAALKAANATALLESAGVLLAADASAEERRTAASALAQSGVPAAARLLESAVDARDPAVQIAALEAWATVPGPDAVRIATAAMRSDAYESAVRLAAVEVLGELRTAEAGEALWAASSDRALPDLLRRAAREELERSYPALLAARGRPADAGSVLGVIVGSAGNGLAGAVMLSAVGTWGQNEGAAVIGGIGGGIIGVGTGALYGATKSTTLGQGAAYTSGAGWGFTGSLLASNAILGPRTGRIPWEYWEEEGGEEEATRKWRNAAAGLRLAGTLGGATAGWFWMRSDPSPEDVLEVDLAGYLGTEMGVGAADLMAGRTRSCVYEGPEYDLYGFVESVDCDDFFASVKGRSWAGLGGMALGLGAGALASPGWSPDLGDLSFGLVVGAETGWVGAFLPMALDVDEPDGNFRLAFHGGVAGGLLAAHFLDPSPRRAALTGWGAVLGNGLGAGLPMLAGAETGQVVTGTMLPVGVAGTVAGAVLAPKLGMDAGDVAMLGVGVPLGIAQGVAMGSVLQDEGVLEGDRGPGLALTFSALNGMLLTGLTVPAEPQVDDMLFLGSAAAWGVWYGLLTPVAMDLDLDGTELTLSSMITGDAFLLIGGLALPEATLNLNPRRTVLPQLAGVTGATLGALGAALASPEGADVARGAVIGSTVGLVGGGVIVALVPPREPRRAALLLPEIDPPGDWHASLGPGALEDGSTGVVATVGVTGW